MSIDLERRPLVAALGQELRHELDALRGIRLADRSDLTVFRWTQECGRCPMCVQDNRANSGTTRSTLIWGIPAQT